LIEQIDTLLPTTLKNGDIETYIEPFVGGGALLFHILSKYKIQKAVQPPRIKRTFSIKLEAITTKLNLMDIMIREMCKVYFNFILCYGRYSQKWYGSTAWF
jgi:site-specific DNA-adenine methylase